MTSRLRSTRLHAKRKGKESLQNVALRSGYLVSRTVPGQDVRHVFELLRPVKIDIPLIRLGGDHDGGYLVPDDLEDLVAISPGVAAEVSFDLALADRGVPVHMFDASVSGPPVSHRNFHFTKKFLESYDSDSSITLDSIADHIAPTGELLLEMDIEGAEYRVLHAASESVLRRLRVIILELHDLQDAASASRHADIRSAFEKLRKTHDVVHVHPNNGGPSFTIGGSTLPGTVEVTLLRRGRAAMLPGPPSLPHALDHDCSPEYKTMPVPNIWR